MRSPFARLTSLLLLATVVSACGNDVFSPSEENARAEAAAKWAARPFTNYVFEMRQDCQCPEVALAWNRVEVVNGIIVKVTPVGGTVPVEPELHPLWLTVEDLFLRLRGPHPDRNVIDIRAQYDATLGYPTQADFIYEGLFSDQTTSYFLRNAGPLTN
ncbi:MAG TPA: DUF6174 domain-containing protein [Gemmatimonadales bacterium]|nr:DUF6174 domain-containing protein [Gemmatimonadales bacterium]